jgi:predicted DNA-binding transcriptional regulator YafY
VVRPLGLILKAGTWYFLARSRTGADDRLFRLSRVLDASLLGHRFEVPEDFDLTVAWACRKEAFAASIPTFYVDVRVAPDGERLLPRLGEGTPALPLPPGVERDQHGWAQLRLRFEERDSAARHLLTMGGAVEVLRPPELRDIMADAATTMAALYQRTR